MLAPASAADRYQGPYFADHVRFVWREHRVRYVATLHTFGEAVTTALLGRIVASLVPAARLAPVKRPPHSAEVGSGPDALAADIMGVWVATQGTSGDSLNGRLIRLDPVSLRPSVRPAVPPKGIRIVVGQGAVWTLGYGVTPDGQNLTPPELERVDPGTGRVTGRVGLGPGEVTGIAIGAGSVWVIKVGPYPRYPAFVVRVDPGTMRIRTRTPVGRGAATLAVTGRSVWVVNAAANTVSQVDASTGRLFSTVPVGRHPFAIAVGSGSIWVSNAADGTVSRIDPRVDRVTATIAVGRAPYGVAAGTHDVWVAVLGAGKVVRIDARSNRITGRVNVHGDPLAIAATGRFVYVTLNADGLVLRIDPTNLFP
jgi:YVTN family beta-propeller protein